MCTLVTSGQVASNTLSERRLASCCTTRGTPCALNITVALSGIGLRPVDTFTGGTHAALKLLRHFVQYDLAHYEQKRNHPELKGTSRMSPYLHFGNIGPIPIALAVEGAVKRGRATAAAIPGSRLESLPTGHVAFSSDPAGFLAIATPFLAAAHGSVH